MKRETVGHWMGIIPVIMVGGFFLFGMMRPAFGLIYTTLFIEVDGVGMQKTLHWICVAIVASGVGGAYCGVMDALINGTSWRGRELKQKEGKE